MTQRQTVLVLFHVPETLPENHGLIIILMDQVYASMRVVSIVNLIYQSHNQRSAQSNKERKKERLCSLQIFVDDVRGREATTFKSPFYHKKYESNFPYFVQNDFSCYRMN